jgi:UDP-N-acetylglucosamine 1-carboxyvinyltransferase
MIASLLTPERLTLKNVPNLADVAMLARILRNHGVDCAVDGKRAHIGHMGETFHLTARDIVDSRAPYDLVRRMRASFWVLGPLLARHGEATVSLPGGCAIGTRPVDLHLMGLRQLGAELDLDGGYVLARAPRGLTGARIVFDKVSVGATHNVLMAAVLAKGETVLENAAREPEVADLAQCLVKMGAKIEGIGTSTLHIQGASVAATGGDVLLEGARPDLLDMPFEVLRGAGVQITETDRGIRIVRNGASLSPVSVETQPFPGFPTDLQAQLMALVATASGVSQIRETIFENRFMHVQELARLGADIAISGETATVKGVPSLRGAEVMATDLRASVSLVIAGLIARGDTEINRVYHLDRGFERLEEKLSACGAQIERLTA